MRKKGFNLQKDASAADRNPPASAGLWLQDGGNQKSAKTVGNHDAIYANVYLFYQMFTGLNVKKRFQPSV